jgi:hypothetical protein
LLSRPASDPELVDVISLTHFYRLRASIFARAPARPALHRYATAAPHAPGGGASPDVVFETMKCNGGEPISLSPVRDVLYLRPLILGLLASIGDVGAAKRALPPDAPFTLAPVSADLKGLNRLRGAPETAPDGVPVGGIPMLEAVLPLGLPRPIVLSPVEIASINDTCNLSGWRPFPVDELRSRYRARELHGDRSPKDGGPRRAPIDGKVEQRGKREQGGVYQPLQETKLGAIDFFRPTSGRAAESIISS